MMHYPFHISKVSISSLSDRGWLLIRPSGTEPILRIYAEARSPEAVKALLEAGQAMADLIVR